VRYARLVLIITVSLILLSGCGAKSQPNVLRSVKSGSDLELAIELPKQKYIAGKDHFAKLSLKNLGSKPLTFNKGDLFKVAVLDKNNKVVWPDGSIPGLKGYAPVTLEKGEAHSQELVFSVKKPGTYKIYCILANGAVKKADGERITRDAPPRLKTDNIVIKVEKRESNKPVI